MERPYCLSFNKQYRVKDAVSSKNVVAYFDVLGIGVYNFVTHSGEDALVLWSAIYRW